jgi:predicted Zn-dependent protease
VRDWEVVIGFAVILLCALAAVSDVERGVSLLRERRLEAADREFRRILEARPKDSLVRLYLARTLIERDRAAEALSEIEAALAGQPGPEVELEAGAILRELAERRLTQLERAAPNSASFLEMAGARAERQGRLSEALAAYRTAAAREPDRPGIHYRIGTILWKQRELEGAAAELALELSRSPHHAMASLRLGQVLLAADQATRAVPHLERAAAEMAESLEAHRELGKAYRKTGKAAEALREWEAVALARPEDDQIHFLLGTLYRELGQTERARSELERHRQILQRRSARAGER